MRQDVSSLGSKPWTAVLIVLVVLGTVALGFFFAQQDTLLLSGTPTAEVVALITATSTLPSAEVTPTTDSSTVIIVATATTAPSPTPSPSPTLVASTPKATAASPLPEPACGQIPVGWVPHVVQVGDTLARLSLASGATVAEIGQANCLEMNLIYLGTEIYLPPLPPTRPPCGPPAWWERYTVNAGETMYSLATARGTTVYEVMVANCLTSPYLLAGRAIFLPPLPATPTPVPPTAAPPPPATDTPVPPPPTATATSVPPTATATATVATVTATAVPPTATATVTVTSPPATATATATPTVTTAAPTATATATTTPTLVPPTDTPTPTVTATAVPPTDTPTPSPTP